MSRTLSKIFVICALVAVLPLMIIGTAFAAYYSINATVSIEVYVDQDVNGGHAEVSYGDQTGRVGKKLEITDGHLKKVTFKTSSVGYDFVGWYAGTYKAFASELEQGTDIHDIKYVVKTKDAKVEMTDYQNLVAVFAAKHFIVSYKYTIGKSGTETQHTPTSNKGLVVDGEEVKTDGEDLTEEFLYGEKLHTIELKGDDTQSFDGWYVGEGDKKYTTATFTEEGEITLTGKWEESRKITLKYLDENGHELTTKTVGGAPKTDPYADHTFTLEDPLAFTYGEGFVKDGYTYGWRNVKTGEIVTSIFSSEDVTVKISRTAVVYTAKLVCEDEGIQLKDSVQSTITFTVEDKTVLDAWKDASNYATTYKFWHFDKLTYNGATVTDFATDVIDRVVAEHTNETAEVEITASKKSDVTEITFETLEYKSEGDTTFNGDVYRDSESNKMDAENGALSESDLSKTLYDLFGFNADTKFYKESTHENEVFMRQISLNGKYTIAVTAETTLADFIEKIYEEAGDNISSLLDGQTLKVTGVLRFAA